MNCDYLRTKSNIYRFFEMDSLEDASPAGYRAKLRLSVVGEKEAWITLSADEAITSGYEFGNIIIKQRERERIL